MLFLSNNHCILPSSRIDFLAIKTYMCVCFQGYSLSVWMCIDSKIRPAAHALTQKRETRVRAAVFHIRTRHRLLTIELREIEG